MKIYLNRRGNSFCALFFILICISCESYTSEKNITYRTPDIFTNYAQDTDSIVIKSVSIQMADKRFYGGPVHADIGLSYQLLVRNRSRDMTSFVLRDSIWNSDFTAVYLQDTVCWLSYNAPDTLRIQYGESATFDITNIGFMGGAFYLWERLFPSSDDYTDEILAILPDVKVYYKDQIILPLKDVTLTTWDYKDRFLTRLLGRLSCTPYRHDIDWDRNEIDE